MSVAHQPVSSPSESLILVDEQDNEIGVCAKAECHEGDGLLHRAFSVFLFNPNGDLLLQQRSAQKPLWPMYWANSCCSHPRESESVVDAGHRRVREELNIDCNLEFLYSFQYQAHFENLGAEHEYCHVFAGKIDGTVAAHPEEIAATRFISPEQLTAEIAAAEHLFTPWLILEWERIRADFLTDILDGIR